MSTLVPTKSSLSMNNLNCDTAQAKKFVVLPRICVLMKRTVWSLKIVILLRLSHNLFEKLPQWSVNFNLCLEIKKGAIVSYMINKENLRKKNQSLQLAAFVSLTLRGFTQCPRFTASCKRVFFKPSEKIIVALIFCFWS